MSNPQCVMADANYQCFTQSCLHFKGGLQIEGFCSAPNSLHTQAFPGSPVDSAIIIGFAVKEATPCILAWNTTLLWRCSTILGVITVACKTTVHRPYSAANVSLHGRPHLGYRAVLDVTYNAAVSFPALSSCSEQVCPASSDLLHTYLALAGTRINFVIIIIVIHYYDFDYYHG